MKKPEKKIHELKPKKLPVKNPAQMVDDITITMKHDLCECGVDPKPTFRFDWGDSTFTLELECPKCNIMLSVPKIGYRIMRRLNPGTITKLIP